MFLGVDLFVCICLGFIGTHQSVVWSLLSLLENFYSSLYKHCLCLTYFPLLSHSQCVLDFLLYPLCFCTSFLYILTFSLSNAYSLDNFSSSVIHLTNFLLCFVHSAVKFIYWVLISVAVWFFFLSNMLSPLQFLFLASIFKSLPISFNMLSIVALKSVSGNIIIWSL